MIYALTPFVFSALLCLGLIVSSARLSWLMRRNDLIAVQASHTRQTSRLGGFAIIVALAGIVPFLPGTDARSLPVLLFLSALPVFGAGLAEDLGFGVSPRWRLAAAAVSSVAAIFLTGTWIRAAGLPGIDELLSFVPFAIILTILWTSGLCHATNLIDGMNGLAGGFSALAAICLSAIAWNVGDVAVYFTTLTLASAIIGFLIFNWPSGRIFLGDTGAYTIGHLLAWCGIVLVWRNPEVTGTAIALLFFWPVADTLFSMWRRSRLGKPIDQPDRMHVHQVVMRWLEIAGLGRRRRYISNPLTTVILMPFILFPMLVALVLADSGILALLAWVVFAALFVMAYRVGGAWARGRRNPIDVIRPARTVPIGEAVEAMEMTPAVKSGYIMIDVSPKLRIMRKGERSNWTAFVQDSTGTWRMLDRRFASKEKAIRSARRSKIRDEISTQGRRIIPKTSQGQDS